MYAINATNDGWRAIASQADLLPGETFSATQPVLIPTVQQQKDAISAAAQNHLDAAARRRGYQDAATCVSYMGSTNAAYKADAASMNQWRDDAWNYSITQLALATLPSTSAILAGIDALTSNPKW